MFSCCGSGMFSGSRLHGWVPLEAVLEHPTESTSLGQTPKTRWGDCLSHLAWECLRNFQVGLEEVFVAGDLFSQHPVDIKYNISASQTCNHLRRESA